MANKAGAGNFIVLWLIGIIPSTIICFIALALPFFQGTAQLAPNEADNPSIGLFLVLYCIVSLVIGFFGSMIIAAIISRVHHEVMSYKAERDLHHFIYRVTDSSGARRKKSR